jgi:3-isopropylmalate/(R)-2-methylmalate dehydratase small subunit
MTMSRIDRITGRAVPLRGHDIDTDRIIPARFLKCVSFEGLETHVFEDDRQQLEERGSTHAFSNPSYKGASVLVVNGNFGCGSSREHAPQALQRWGIRGVIGESFSEIFFGTSVALGMPCLTVSARDAEALLTAVETNPQAELSISVAGQSVEVGGKRFHAAIPAGVREALTSGSWDATGALLDEFDQVRKVAAQLPYIQGF